MSSSKQPNIAIIGAITFLCASKLLGYSNFELYLCSSDIQANSTKLAEASDLSNVPSEYHKFTDIFSKTKAEVLASHHSYDLKNNLEEGTQPLVGVVTTTRRNSTCDMLTSAKLSVSSLVVGIIRELNKELLLHCFSIYINTMWSMLQQYLLVLMSMPLPHVLLLIHHASISRPPCHVYML